MFKNILGWVCGCGAFSYHQYIYNNEKRAGTNISPATTFTIYTKVLIRSRLKIIGEGPVVDTKIK